MRRALAGFAAWSALSGAAPVEPPPFSEAIEGELRAVSCLLDGRPVSCDRPALAAGMPAVVRAGGDVVVLLLDPRTLAGLCPASNGATRVRAHGFLHDGRRSMTVVRVESRCADTWKIEDLPYSGISGGGVEAGNE